MSDDIQLLPFSKKTRYYVMAIIFACFMWVSLLASGKISKAFFDTDPILSILFLVIMVIIVLYDIFLFFSIWEKYILRGD